MPWSMISAKDGISISAANDGNAQTDNNGKNSNDLHNGCSDYDDDHDDDHDNYDYDDDDYENDGSESDTSGIMANDIQLVWKCPVHVVRALYR